MDAIGVGNHRAGMTGRLFEVAALEATGREVGRTPTGGDRQAVHGGQLQLVGRGLLATSEAAGLVEHNDARKVAADRRRVDPARFPFRSLYTAVMDLSAEIFLDQVRLVFQDFTLAQGRLAWRGRRVDPRAIRRTALTTIEAELDDIAPPGQTRSAHALCENVPNDARRHLLQPAIGHFGTFHGRVWRAVIMPFIAAALRASR